MRTRVGPPLYYGSRALRTARPPLLRADFPTGSTLSVHWLGGAHAKVAMPRARATAPRRGLDVHRRRRGRPRKAAGGVRIHHGFRPVDGSWSGPPAGDRRADCNASPMSPVRARPPPPPPPRLLRVCRLNPSTFTTAGPRLAAPSSSWRRLGALAGGHVRLAARRRVRSPSAQASRIWPDRPVLAVWSGLPPPRRSTPSGRGRRPARRRATPHGPLSLSEQQRVDASAGPTSAFTCRCGGSRPASFSVQVPGLRPGTRWSTRTRHPTRRRCRRRPDVSPGLDDALMMRTFPAVRPQAQVVVNTSRPRGELATPSTV